jgi:hypothetical protein
MGRGHPACVSAEPMGCVWIDIGDMTDAYGCP